MGIVHFINRKPTNNGLRLANSVKQILITTNANTVNTKYHQSKLNKF